MAISPWLDKLKTYANEIKCHQTQSKTLRRIVMKKIGAIIDLVFRAVGLAMGVAATVMSFMGVADTDTLITLLAIGMFCLGVAALDGAKEETLDEI
jgi:hypothetical protein